MAQVVKWQKWDTSRGVRLQREKTGGRRLKRNVKKQADGLSLGWGRGGAGDNPDRGLGREKDRKGAGQTEELGGWSCIPTYPIPGLHHSCLVA